MKQCPVCKTTYTDDSLRFCLADGSVLVEMGVQQTAAQRSAPTDETVAIRPDGGHMRVDIPQQSSRTSGPPPYQNAALAAGGSSGSVYKILAAVLVGLLGLLLVAAGIFIYLKTGGTERASVNNTSTEIKTPSPFPTPQKDDKDELRDQIANLEKMLNDQKKSKQPANIPLNLPNQPITSTTARVNSPGDGFLALRTFPNSQAGERILKIPDGANISVGACLNPSRIGDRSGRWCRASYNGYSGWVFDAFLVY